jgi:hypothetical protein
MMRCTYLLSTAMLVLVVVHGAILTVNGEEPAIICQLPTPVTCPAFELKECAQTPAPPPTVTWEAKYDDDDNFIGYKPIFHVNNCDATETIAKNLADATACGNNSLEDGTHKVDAGNNKEQICWITRHCKLVPEAAGGPPQITLPWNTEPDGSGDPIHGTSEIYHYHYCQPFVSIGLLPTDVPEKITWVQCDAYTNCQRP